MSTCHLEPEIYYYTFGCHEPALCIHSGDTVMTETRDCYGYDAECNPIPEYMKHQVLGMMLKESNPVVGPIYVEDTEPGDLLAVNIQRIRLNRDFALSQQGPNFGSLTGERPGHNLLYNDPIRTVWYEWKLDLERHVGTLELPNSRMKHVEVPLNPFIGTIGVAPRFGRVEMTLTPGEYGGNMDCPETCEGTTLYLPVWADGAYLSFGDVHALQGDGEIIGTIDDCGHRNSDFFLREAVSHGGIVVARDWQPFVLDYLFLLQQSPFDFGFVSDGQSRRGSSSVGH
ncbi:MAG: acetamidase/formamidase family protein [Anaerolineae bacterium]|nr:acetamidase/formamidase family protein [Anaerolineae bacterium]